MSREYRQKNATNFECKQTNRDFLCNEFRESIELTLYSSVLFVFQQNITRLTRDLDSLIAFSRIFLLSQTVRIATLMKEQTKSDFITEQTVYEMKESKTDSCDILPRKLSKQQTQYLREY